MMHTFTKINISIVAIFAVMVMLTPVVMNQFTLESATAFALGGNNGGDGGSGGSSGGTCCTTPSPTPTPTPTPTPDPEPAICNYLRADTNSLPAGGGDVTLSWSSSRGTSATLTPAGSAVALNSTGSVVQVTQDTTFVFRVTNSDGSDTCQVSVAVAEELPSCDYLHAAPTSLPVGGGNTVLTWETTNADSVRISGLGTVAADNTVGRTVPVTQTTTFVLTASNIAGDDTCQQTVTVVPTTPIASCDFFDVAPTSLPYGGGTTVLTWGTTNATSVSISGIGVVADDNSVGRSVAVTQTTTFVLTATNVHGTDTCSKTVTVANPNAISCAANVNFSASPTSFPYGGGDTTLTWSTTGIDSLTITDVASRALSGNAVVHVSDDKTYTLTATTDGRSVSCPLSIAVAERSGGGGGSSSPRCTLKVSDDEINRGQEVTLTWTSTYADEITLKDNHGNIIVNNTDDNDDLDSDIKVRPTSDTTYTLLAEKGSRDTECDVEVEVKDSITVTEIRNQLPLVAGISLTQVPYTGFEAGPMLTTIFYGLLTLWGLFVAYLVAVRRNMIGGVSLAGAHDHVAYTDASTEATAEVSPAAEYVAAVATADVPANLPTGTTPVVGYAAAFAAEEVDEAAIDASMAMTELENRAHMQKALFSSDAMRFFMKTTAEEAQFTALDALIARAKAAYPAEDGWLVINLARLESLLGTTIGAATVAAEVTPGNGGSLAEAIVTGNIVAAYQLIAHRPMIAVADAAAELDAVVRSRRGEVVSLSAMLAAESARLSDAQVSAAISALTSAIDGIYTSEEEAVKMAIMKAVKAVA